MKAPFPYFGGKSRIAAAVWQRLGDVRNYVEPFFGSGACLLSRPTPFVGVETVNDKCGYIANFWRAVQHDPEATAFHADHPVNENDLHARHSWLIAQRDDIVAKLEGDPDWFDAKIAGWWCWGICCWIGSGFCSGKGPWQVVDGQLIRLGNAGQGVNRKLIRLGNAGQGVNRKLIHLGNAGQGVNRKLIHLGNAGQGVNRQLIHLGDAGGQGITSTNTEDFKDGIYGWFSQLAARLERVRVCSGDWTRVTSPTVIEKHGTCGIFLDPPYADTAKRTKDLYAQDCEQTAHAVREWAIAHGDNPILRIALCGYESEHQMPDSWECLVWKTSGGYGSQGSQGSLNSNRERIWFSPHCLKLEASKNESFELVA